MLHLPRALALWLLWVCLSSGRELQDRYPRVWIQLGPPRSQTSLQFVAACLLQITLHPSSKVRCFYGHVGVLDFLQHQHSEESFIVHKRHEDLEVIANAASRTNTTDLLGYLLTAEKEGSNWKHDLALAQDACDQLEGCASLVFPKNVLHVQTTGRVRLMGYRVAEDLGEAFALPRHELDVILNFLRHWSVMRQCCGKELSETWREQLQGQVQEKWKFLSRRWSEVSPQYPACETYDINEVQRALARNPLFASVVEAFDEFDAGRQLEVLKTENRMEWKVLNCQKSWQWMKTDGADAHFGTAFPKHLYEPYEEYLRLRPGEGPGAVAEEKASQASTSSKEQTAGSEQTASWPPSTSPSELPPSSVALSSDQLAPGQALEPCPSFLWVVIFSSLLSACCCNVVQLLVLQYRFPHGLGRGGYHVAPTRIPAFDPALHDK